MYLLQTTLLQEDGRKVLRWIRRVGKVCDGLLQGSFSLTVSVQLSQGQCLKVQEDTQLKHPPTPHPHTCTPTPTHPYMHTNPYMHTHPPPPHTHKLSFVTLDHVTTECKMKTKCHNQRPRRSKLPKPSKDPL